MRFWRDLSTSDFLRFLLFLFLGVRIFFRVGVVGVLPANTPSPVQPLPQTSPTTQITKKQQIFPRIFTARYQGIPEGVLLGVTQNIPKEVYKSFLDSGLVYLVAASGGNVAFIAMIVGMVFLFLPYKYRQWAQAGVIVGYGQLLRSNMALKRAVFSYLTVIFVRLQGRRLSAKNVLLVVVVGCLLWNPYLFSQSRGFLLSVSGVRGILHIPKKLQQHIIRRYVAPSARAFLALMGPLLVLVQKVNVFTVFASIPAGFITIGISYFSLLVYIVGGVGLSGPIGRLGETLGDLLYLLVKGLCLLSDIVAKHGIYFVMKNSTFAYSIRFILWLFIWSLQKVVDHKRD